MSECWTCMGPCDSEYHASSKRLRRWLLRKIDLAAAPVMPAKPRTLAPRVTGVRDLKLDTIEQRKRASRLGGLGGRR